MKTTIPTINDIYIGRYPLKNGNLCTIRPMKTTDADAYIQLMYDIIASTPDALLTKEEFESNLENLSEWIEAYETTPTWALFVAEIQGTLVGYIDFQNILQRRAQHIGDFGMGVRTACQNIGIGRQLLQHLLQWAKSIPILEKINLNVLAHNTHAIQLYHKMGFKLIGRSEGEVKMEDGRYLTVLKMSRWV